MPQMASLFPRLAAVCTIAIALCALAGWALGMSALKSLLPQEAPIEANAAVALLLAGGALFTLSRGAPARGSSARLLAAAVLLIGLATLAQHVFDADLRIDELLFRDTSEVPGSVPGRMSPYSAVALIGIGLALITFNAPSLRPLVWTSAALTAFIGAFRSRDTSPTRTRSSRTGGFRRSPRRSLSSCSASGRSSLPRVPTTGRALTSHALPS